jgi:microcystin-dependent protein
MATITLRSIKGSPLTLEEVDSNFININTELGLKLDASAFTTTELLDRIRTVDGAGSGLDADLLDGLNASTTHVSGTSTIVARNTTGNFSANVITATLIGNVTGNLTGNVTGNVNGNATGLSTVLPITNGGTGGSSTSSARSNLGLGSISTQNSNAVTITGGTISGITDITIADGGTGASTAAEARSNLGLSIGVNVQAYDPDLSGLAGIGTNGFIVRTGNGTFATRSIQAGVGLSITTPDGISGNPTLTNTGVTAIVAGSGVSINNTTGNVTVNNTGVRSINGQTGDLVFGTFVPPGAVFMFAMPTAPAGYLPCDGSAVSRATFPQLFAAIGTTFGAGNGTTTFNIPDMRAMFPRGWDNGRGIDQPRDFGTTQQDENKAHTHFHTDSYFSFENGNDQSFGSGLTGATSRDFNNSLFTHTRQTQSQGTTEARPKNVALLFCIKT